MNIRPLLHCFNWSLLIAQCSMFVAHWIENAVKFLFSHIINWIFVAKSGTFFNYILFIVLEFCLICCTHTTHTHIAYGNTHTHRNLRSCWCCCYYSSCSIFLKVLIFHTVRMFLRLPFENAVDCSVLRTNFISINSITLINSNEVSANM